MIKDDDRQQEILNGHVREVMKTPSGKAIVWSILTECGVYASMCTGDNQTFFLEGKREIGLQLIDMLNTADPTIYPRLMLDQLKGE